MIWIQPACQLDREDKLSFSFNLSIQNRKIMTSKWKICQCSEFKCKDETYQDEKQNQQRGRAFSKNAFRKHEQEIRRLNSSKNISALASKTNLVQEETRIIEVSFNSARNSLIKILN